MPANLLDAKTEYKEFRNKEKELLLKVFDSRHYAIHPRRGESRSDYTCGKTMSNFDNSNWIWGVANKFFFDNKVEIFVYFQTPVTDPITKNNISLFDRLCYSFTINGLEKNKDKFIFTNYDLPLCERDYHMLVDDIESEIKKYI